MSPDEYKLILEHTPQGILVVDAKYWSLTYANPAALCLLGADLGSLSMRGIAERAPSHQPDGRASVAAAAHYIAVVLESGQADFEWLILDENGETLLCHVHAVRIGPPAEQQIVCNITDISERQAAAEALQESQQQLEAAQQIARLGSWQWDIRADRITWSAQLFKLFGVSPDEFDASYAAFLDFVHPDDRDVLNDAVQTAVSRQSIYEVEARIIPANGSAWIMHAWGEVIVNDAGESVAMAGVAQDVTARRRDQQEREQLAAQLAQAQRMEAVGLLTGGVAHDFNNVLTVFFGCLEMMKREIRSDKGKKLLAGALESAERAAQLTRRLLAFSRKQPLKPRVVDVNRLVLGLDGLLRGTLGEAVEIEVVAGEGLWTCEIDPAQLENAIVNLAINARDAMPKGGKLTIESKNADLDRGYAGQESEVEPGQYVLLVVSDNGTGMTSKVQERAFEPFFTTKEVGFGSGLGLSMVYGFVKQSRGHVTLSSEEGQGTTVAMYLPRAAPGARADPPRLPDKEHTVGSGQLILVVEDEHAVRLTTVAMLEQLGYRTLQAEDARKALKRLKACAEVELLFTDVVLPGGISGVELAAQVRRERPNIRVLFTSGYTRHASVDHGQLGSDVDLLEKPFSLEQLSKGICEVLG